jgi:hypothetical protein
MKSQFEQNKLDRMKNHSENYVWEIFYSIQMTQELFYKREIAGWDGR